VGTPNNNENETYFASISDSYDRIQPIIAGPSYGFGLDMVVDLIPYDTGDIFQFVELGCGTAELSARILERFPQARGTCIDNEPVMLEIARKRFQPLSKRSEVREGDMTVYEIPICDVVFSAKAFHHVNPHKLNTMLSRIAEALRPGGCFILFDNMEVGQTGNTNIRRQKNIIDQQHVSQAIETGKVTQDEIDARWSFKRKMKAEGKDTEYRHRADDILKIMRGAGFVEAGRVWQMFADTVLVGFIPEAH